MARRGSWLAAGAALVVAIAGVGLVASGRGRRPRRAGGTADDGRPVGSAIVEIASEPSGARVLEDGTERGLTPLVLPVAPGREIAIDIERSGYRSVRRTVTASAGEPVSIVAELVAIADGGVESGVEGVGGGSAAGGEAEVGSP
jgi:hypothetical protein